MSSMPTVAQRASHSGTRKPLYASAALALAVEALLLAGVGAWLIRPPIAAPKRPEPMTITLAPSAVPAQKPAPIPAPVPPAAVAAREVSKPLPKPAMQPPRAPTASQARVAHVVPPRPRTQPQPQPKPVVSPSAPTPAPAANTEPAQSAAPTEPAPASRPAPTPAPARSDASFESALRAAIQAALRYPESARMEGTTGRTLVAFVYRDGAVSDIRVVTSSGMGRLDHAALAAVRDAACPPPPHGLEGKSLSEQLWVDFTLDGKG
ncbi:TonB family protein [Paraburkholderia piptadeniae]|uniref:TonB family protein n=1 Tax=Paraburkholderia piptadeniae TaxID=1701573 RepID=A0A1N7SR28_9BURK|nr:TonB family protein [Paraburkholderia piptadeniae]SIT49791.1 TonB family protein [Paraburkholderia piptadeniae]